MSDSISTVIVVVLASLLLMVSLLSFLKIRKVHLAMFSLQAETKIIHKESIALFPQIQALFSLEKKMMLSQGLPPMRGWAGSPDFLLAVADNVTEFQPECVMECSSGVSTVVLARALQLNGSTGHVYSLEHDPLYANKTREMLSKYQLNEFATVIDAPLKNNKNGLYWYDISAIPSCIPPVELLIVDGPPANSGNSPRFPAFVCLREYFADHFSIIVDDADRDDEIEMVKKWLEIDPGIKRVYHNFEKGMVVLSK